MSEGFKMFKSPLYCLLAWASLAVATAQPPIDTPPVVLPEAGPRIEDANVLPAQLQSPVRLQPIPMQPGTAGLSAAPVINGLRDDLRFAGMPPQPPTPSVQIMVLVPQDIPPGKEIPCTIRVTNVSGADAFKVRVRVPAIEGATVVKADPPQLPVDKATPELVWDLKTVKSGITERIELTLKPTPGVGAVQVRALVAFEHGQTVKTSISEPKLKVKTELPKQATADEPVPVRVTVMNTGKVPLTGVRLREVVSDGFEFATESGGEAVKEFPRQRIWTLGSLPAGMQKVVEYRLNTSQGRGLLVTSTVVSEEKVDGSDEAKTQVLDTGLRVELRGDERSSGEGIAAYELTVTNTGSLPVANIRVTGSIPADSRLTRKRVNGQEYRDGIVWTIPKLAPGDRESFAWSLQSTDGGRKSVRGTAVGRVIAEQPGSNGQLVSRTGKTVEHSAVFQTLFGGSSDLRWERAFDQALVSVDRTGTMTIKVSNRGTEAAGNVRLVIDFPKDLVSGLQASPKGKIESGRATFGPITLGANQSETFTLTFRGEKPGRAIFLSKLFADPLGDKPLGAEPQVEIVRR
jgi:hypothetical protein